MKNDFVEPIFYPWKCVDYGHFSLKFLKLWRAEIMLTNVHFFNPLVKHRIEVICLNYLCPSVDLMFEIFILSENCFLME